MARYKDHSYDQLKLLSIRYSEQIPPGTFEHTLHHVIDEIDLALFDARYRNDVARWPTTHAQDRLPLSAPMLIVP